MMKMKRRMGFLALAALLLAAGAAGAQEDRTLDGEIRAGQTRSITAPFSGRVGDFAVCEGDVLRGGDALFTLDATEVYADHDGTVVAVFAQPGDSAAVAREEYGALLYIERDTLYRGACTTSSAASDNENKLVHPGERVFIRSSNDEKRKGEARVLGVEGKSYTIEVTRIDDLRVGESVKVYRESSYASDSCIGSGKLERVDPVAVTAEGYVLAVDVAEGQRVQRGDCLLSTVPDELPGRAGGGCAVISPEDGVVISVRAQSGVQASQDEVLATYCPMDAMELVCSVDETELAGLAEGMSARVTLDGAPGEVLRASLKKIARTANGQGEYDVTFTLESSEAVRIGMSATAVLRDVQ